MARTRHLGFLGSCTVLATFTLSGVEVSGLRNLAALVPVASLWQTYPMMNKLLSMPIFAEFRDWVVTG